MLRYLTHKLRTQSLNETETYHVKTDDDRDSGTESDDEGAEIEELQKYMESIIHLDSRHSEQQQRRGGGRRQPPPPPPPQPNNHHPSEQQQVTSGDAADSSRHHHHNRHHHHRPRRRPTTTPTTTTTPDDAALVDSALPSDGSDHNFDHHSSEEELEVINNGGGGPEKRKWECSGGNAADDDAAHHYCCPVQFRTSPPAHAHRPGSSRLLCLRQQGNAIPPHELFFCSASPRKRHRRTPIHQTQRPCLDFEKMQQVMVMDVRNR